LRDVCDRTPPKREAPTGSFSIAASNAASFSGSRSGASSDCRKNPGRPASAVALMRNAGWSNAVTAAACAL
jgi:hypothetical protein